MDPLMLLRTAYIYFDTKWVNLYDLQKRYAFLKGMYSKEARRKKSK